MKTLVHLVEDDGNIANVIQIALQNSGYDVHHFSHALEMFKSLDTEKPQLFILDLMLPDLDGYTIIQTIKKQADHRDIPILIVSAKTSEMDKVQGLDFGADDYLVKPFGVLELISRVKAILRRVEKPEPSQIIEMEGIRLDSRSHECWVQNQIVYLTAKEFSLLKTLMQANNQTLTRDFLLNQVWGFDFFGESRTLDVHIKELRQKLGKAGGKIDWIQTIRSVGYKFSG